MRRSLSRVIPATCLMLVFAYAITRTAAAPPIMTAERLREVIGFDASETLILFRWNLGNTVEARDAFNDPEKMTWYFMAVATDGRLFQLGHMGGDGIARTGKLSGEDLLALHATLGAAPLCGYESGVDAVPCGGWWSATVSCRGVFDTYGSMDVGETPLGGGWPPQTQRDRAIGDIGRFLSSMAIDAELAVFADDFYATPFALDQALGADSAQKGK